MARQFIAGKVFNARWVLERCLRDHGMRIDEVAVRAASVKLHDFETRESGEVRLSDKGRKVLFASWQDRKREEIMHPYLKEKVPWGLIPHVQALLLSRCIRGDLDGYPAFLWK